MSLLSYVVFSLAGLLGGLVLLVIFSLLTMAQKGDKYQDQLEFALRQRQNSAPSLVNPAKSEDLGSPAISDPGQVDVPQPRMLISR